MNPEWSERNKRFQSLLKKATFPEAIQELLSLRQMLMAEALSWKGRLSKEDFCAIPFLNAAGYHSKTVAYSLWHIFRIEDIVVHTLIQKDEQVFFSGSFAEKTHAPICTTGNELVKQQIADSSQALDVEALYQYIEAVSASTEAFLKGLDYAALKTTFGEADREAIRATQTVSTDEKAAWLIDYWCDKDVKGLLFMPLSRHWIMHIEAALRIIRKLQPDGQQG